MKRSVNVAVTGLNATDNPGPGVSVIRALRHHPDFDGRIIGLAYDNLEPGVYARDLVDDVFLVPYPSQGVDALEARLGYIHERVGIDVIVPTLDSELPAFISLENRLADRGIRMFVPSQLQFDLRAKDRLAALGRRAGISVPETLVLRDVTELYSVHETIGFPLCIKGPYYGAEICRTVDDAVRAYHRALAKWGGPIMAQQFVEGVELDVVAVGDGRGGLVGAVPMRKTFLTDKGKGWAGVTVVDDELLALTRRFFEATQWRGPCEVEVVRTRTGEYYLLEVNPRFPAWVYLCAAAGLNLPHLTTRLALGETVAQHSEYTAGTMFVRISIDQVANLGDFEQLAMTGELLSAGAAQ